MALFKLEHRNNLPLISTARVTQTRRLKWSSCTNHKSSKE